MVELKCPKDDCGKEWNYKGTSKFYITCPQCHRKIKLEDLKKKENENENK